MDLMTRRKVSTETKSEKEPICLTIDNECSVESRNSPKHPERAFNCL